MLLWQWHSRGYCTSVQADHIERPPPTARHDLPRIKRPLAFPYLQNDYLRSPAAPPTLRPKWPAEAPEASIFHSLCQSITERLEGCKQAGRSPELCLQPHSLASSFTFRQSVREFFLSHTWYENIPIRQRNCYHKHLTSAHFNKSKLSIGGLPDGGKLPVINSVLPMPVSNTPGHKKSDHNEKKTHHGANSMLTPASLSHAHTINHWQQPTVNQRRHCANAEHFAGPLYVPATPSRIVACPTPASRIN